MTRQASTEIATARARIENAERVLSGAIATSHRGSRADKVTIDAAVSEALLQLKDAKRILAQLESAHFGQSHEKPHPKSK
jgi:hypothetical protein